MITRWRVHGAGTFLPSVQNLAEAELLGSIDGSNYFEMTGFRNNRHDWVDMPVTCEKPVRFVRLQVTKAEGPGALSNRAGLPSSTCSATRLDSSHGVAVESPLTFDIGFGRCLPDVHGVDRHRLVHTRAPYQRDVLAVVDAKLPPA